MVKHPALVSLLAGDELDLVALVELETATTPLRYAIDTKPRTWDGNEFTPTGGTFSEVEESAERGIPSLNLVLQNVDGVLGRRLHPLAGGEDVRGRRVTILQGSRALLEEEGDPEDLVLKWVLFVEDVSWVGRAAVVLQVGVFPAEVVKVPDRTLAAFACRWLPDYKGAACGYVGDLKTCDGTIEGPDGCRVHFGDEPRRFSGWPLSTDRRALVE